MRLDISVPTWRKLYLSLFSLSFCLLCLMTIPLRIILSFLLFVICLLIYMRFEFAQFKKVGIFVHLPPSLQSALLNRSLFDILCDIWYMPTFSLYFKILFRPFIYQTQPEKAIENLAELSNEQKEAALKKGIINLFPDSIKEIMKPEKEFAKLINDGPELPHLNTSNSSSKSTKDLETRLNSSSNFNEEEEEKIYLFNEDLCKNYTDKKITSRNSIKTPSNNKTMQLQNTYSLISFDNPHLLLDEELDDEILLKDIASPKKASISKEKNGGVNFNETFVIADSKKSEEEKNIYKKFNFKSFTSTVINSSKKIANFNLMKKSKEKWDRLESYLGKNFSNNIFNENNMKPVFRIPTMFLKKIMQLKNVKIFGKGNEENKSIFKIFIFSNISLVFLLFISKRTRGWLIHTLLMIAYTLGIILSGGSAIIFGIRYLIKKREQKKLQ